MYIGQVINLDKTKSLTFTIKLSPILDYNQFSSNLSRQDIEQVATVKYLRSIINMEVCEYQKMWIFV